MRNNVSKIVWKNVFSAKLKLCNWIMQCEGDLLQGKYGESVRQAYWGRGPPVLLVKERESCIGIGRHRERTFCRTSQEGA